MTTHQSTTARSGPAAHAEPAARKAVVHRPVTSPRLLTAFAQSGVPEFSRFAPEQRHQMVLDLQRTIGNGAVARLQPLHAPAGVVQREDPPTEKKEVTASSTPPPITTPAPKEAGKEEKPKTEVEATGGIEGEGSREQKAGEKAESETEVSAKFAVKATIPLWQKQAGPFLVLKDFSLEGNVGFGADSKVFRGAALEASVKALSIDFEKIKPPLGIPGSLSIGFDASLVSAGQIKSDSVAFTVGGKLGAEAKYEFKNSPIFLTAELSGQLNWGKVREAGVTTSFNEAKYSGFIGAGVSF